MKRKAEAKTETKYSFLFLAVAAVFITSLITANIIAVKMVTIFGLILPAGVIIFPVSYIFGDILTEVYGYGQARRVIWLGFGCNLLAVLAIKSAQIIPGAGFWDAQAAYERILGFTPRLLLASFAAYLAGEFANSFVLAKLKIMTKGRKLWLRTIGSTVVGQGLDSLIFIIVAFWGVIPAAGILAAILNQWLFKTFYEAAATPVTYLIVNFLKNKERIDAFDYQTSFSPFRL